MNDGMMTHCSAVKRLLILSVVILLTLVFFSSSALAQCALCKTAITASNGVAATAKTMNLAILVLIVPPVSIFCSVFVLAFKHRQPRDDGE